MSMISGVCGNTMGVFMVGGACVDAICVFMHVLM